MFAIAPGVHTHNYLSCLAEHNRALHLHDNVTKKICTLLSCNRRDLDMTVLKERSGGQMTESSRKIIKEFHEAELLLDKTSTLLEIAEELRASRLNAAHKNIDC